MTERADRNTGATRSRGEAQSARSARESVAVTTPSGHVAASPDISPTFCCGRGSARGDKAYSLKPLRRSVGYAFASA